MVFGRLLLLADKSSAADQHGRARQAAVVLLVLHHRGHHAAGLGAGSSNPRHVHYRRQVCFPQPLTLNIQ